MEISGINMQYWEVVTIKGSIIKFIIQIVSIVGTGSIVLEKAVKNNILVRQI